jgi:hypothetical protein
LVGETELAVRCFCHFVTFWVSCISFIRSWVLILGMSGLIVLFWFVGGGVALRFFVSLVTSRL